MIFPLIQDFADALAAMPREHPRYRILKLLDEAIRRDVHFIDRHPTTFFQCMWNTCWWYDCPEAAEHYEEPEGPWKEERPKLHQLLDGWRAAREAAPHRLPLAARPAAAPVHLGGPLRAVLQGHTNAVVSVEFSPDGGRLLSGSHDGTVRLWDAETGQELHCLGGQEAAAGAVAYSPDGGCVAAVRGGTVYLWDPDTGQELGRLRGNQTAGRALAFAPDGRHIAVGSADGSVWVWDVNTGPTPGHLDVPAWAAWSVTYASDGRRVVTEAPGRHGRAMDSAAGRVSRRLAGHGQDLASVAYSPDGRRVAAGSSEGEVLVWDADTGQELQCLRVHRKVGGVAFSPDGRCLVSGGRLAERTVRVWDVETGRELLRIEGCEGGVHGMAYAPDGRRLAAAGVDGTVLVWDAETGRELCRLRGHERRAWSVAFAPDGRRLASGADDCTVRVWEVVGGRAQRRLRGHGDWVWSVAYSPDGRRLITGAENGTVCVWDAGTAQLLDRPDDLRGQAGRGVGVTFAPDGRLVVGDWDCWSARSSEEAWATPVGPPVRVWPSPRLAETVVETGPGRAAAWFPAPLSLSAAHPAGRSWAGMKVASDHLYLVTLEGAI